MFTKILALKTILFKQMMDLGRIKILLKQMMDLGRSKILLKQKLELGTPLLIRLIQLLSRKSVESGIFLVIRILHIYYHYVDYVNNLGRKNIYR